MQNNTARNSYSERLGRAWKKVSPVKQKLIFAGLILLAGALIFLSLTTLSHKPNIIISEILAVNNGILFDEDGDTPDYIELYNAGRTRINLVNWHLSDNENRTLRWRFPTFWIEPGEYVIIFASGKDKVEQGGALHTNFSISASGEPVILTDPRGNVHDRVEPFESFSNISWAKVDNFSRWAYQSPTPGYENTGEYSEDPGEISASLMKVYINEYMSRNDSVFPDENGEFHDWVELYNPNERPVPLSGWTLSDNSRNLYKWAFPLGTVIGAGEYMVLQLSGYDREGHVTFRLSASDCGIFLVNPISGITDELPVYDTPFGTSYGRFGDSYGFFADPTPGEENTVPPVDDLSQIPWSSPTVRINEYASRNAFGAPDEDGDRNDWVELHNYGSSAINLQGMFLSNDSRRPQRWRFRESAVIQPGEFLVVQLSGKNRALHTSFSLGSGSDYLVFSDTNGRTIDKIEVFMMSGNASFGRDINNPERWLFYPRPTPGAANTTQGYEELAGLSLLEWREVYIGEVSLENRVRLHNITGERITLDGWVLSNSANIHRAETSAQSLSAIAIPAGEAVSVNLTQFGLRTAGRELFLFDGDGVLRDRFSTGALRTGVMSGRAPGALTDCRYFFVAGSSTPLSAYSSMPVFSAENGYANIGQSISITTSDSGSIIRYTLDGTAPNEASAIYTTPIVINGDTVIVARTFRSGFVPSDSVTRTYVTQRSHKLPVMAITTHPDNLFSHSTGIFANGPGFRDPFPYVGANFWQNWEREAHFAFYEENGELGVEFNAGMRVFGQFSRALSQKSISINFRNRYSTNEIAYPFFPGNPVTQFGSLVLRNSGQDQNFTKLKDAFLHKTVSGMTELDYQDARPVVVYINGEYWGLYNLREKINENMFHYRYGVPKDEMDIIKGNSRVNAGSNTEFLAFRETVRTLNINTPEGYQYIIDNMDLENWMDWWITQTYIGNTDSGNIRRWKPHNDGKWRWVLFDLDWALWSSTYTGNLIREYMLNPVGHGVGRAFNTDIEIKLMQHEGIRDMFIERYAYHMRTTFDPDRMIAILDEYAAKIEHEMPYHIERWTPSVYGVYGTVVSMNRWEQNLDTVRKIIREKPDLMKGHLRDTFKLTPQRMAELFPE
jgi:hypothetical protein